MVVQEHGSTSAKKTSLNLLSNPFNPDPYIVSREDSISGHLLAITTKYLDPYFLPFFSYVERGGGLLFLLSAFIITLRFTCQIDLNQPSSCSSASHN